MTYNVLSETVLQSTAQLYEQFLQVQLIVLEALRHA